MAVTVFLLGSAGGCMDREALYVEQPEWEAAADAAPGFLGYRGDPAAKVTLCAGCHPQFQAEWAGTAHADAWAGLQDSGHAASYCEACHSVSALGNRVADPNVGWTATADPRFVDVQCESCHGPGLAHVAYPSGTRPLASVNARADATNGCGECHNGTHHPFVEQWSESVHGRGPNTLYAGSQPACAPCHEGKAALEVTFGVTSAYQEKGTGEMLTITCAVCHASHGSPYPGQLRASIEVPTRENLCMRCHTRRGTPWSAHGPHAAQGLLILGQDVGYVPPGSDLDLAVIPNPHGPKNNEGLCATCHVQTFTVTDPQGAFVFENVGHTFAALPCLDEDGVPHPEAICALREKYFKGCTGTGCHGTEAYAREAYLRRQDRLNTLLDRLWADSNKNHVLEATDGGLLPQVLAKGFRKELDPSSSTMTPAKGAIWNAMLAWTDDRPHWADGAVDGVHFGSHPNSGNGVHNPHLLEALLLASIGDVRRAYGLQ
jgi:predicted CXXCH cytochrome family protein